MISAYRMSFGMYLEAGIPRMGRGGDRYVDPLRYQTAKAGTASHAQTMAKRPGGSKVNVNCIFHGFILLEGDHWRQEEGRAPN